MFESSNGILVSLEDSSLWMQMWLHLSIPSRRGRLVALSFPTNSSWEILLPTQVFFISIFKLFFSQMSLGLKPKSWKMIFLDLRKMSSCWWAELRGVGLTQLKPRDPSLADGSRLADTLVQRRPLMGIGSL